ncbi:MAG: fluoride efflux transporter CrcB [Hyphomicrobiaceae bacterium]
MQLFLAAMVGGALGSGARYLVYLALMPWLGPAFPWATITVNIVGSFLMGAVVEASTSLLGGSALLRTFLATGVLGGFTTFSAFSLDAFELFDRRQSALAIFYVAASVILSVVALVGGLAAVRSLK